MQKNIHFDNVTRLIKHISTHWKYCQRNQNLLLTTDLNLKMCHVNKMTRLYVLQTTCSISVQTCGWTFINDNKNLSTFNKGKSAAALLKPQWFWRVGITGYIKTSMTRFWGQPQSGMGFTCLCYNVSRLRSRNLPRLTHMFEMFFIQCEVSRFSIKPYAWEVPHASHDSSSSPKYEGEWLKEWTL